MLLVLFILSIVLSKKRFRNYANPLILFVFLWMMIFYLDNLRLYDLKVVDDETISIITIGIISFVIGAFLASFLDKYRFSIKEETENFSYIFRYRTLYVLALICIVYFFGEGVRSLILILRGVSLDSIRIAVQGSNDSNFIKNIMSNFIIWPISYMLESVAVVDYFLGKKDKLLFSLNIVIIFLRVFADAGRTPLMDFALYMLLGMVYISDEKKVNIWDKVKKYKYLLLGGILLVIATISRSSTTVWRQLYFYFGMSPVLFDYWKGQVDMNSLMTYGYTSLNGIFFPIIYVIKNIFNLDYPSLFKASYDMIARTVSDWVLIINQGRTTANAYVSLFWYFYTDAREYGIVVGSMVYGFIMRRVYAKSIINKNIKILSIYFLLFQGLFFSFIRFPFSKAYYVLAFLYMLFIIKKRKC